MTGVVPGCSPSSSIGSGMSLVTVTVAPRRSSAFGCGRCVPRYIFGTVVDEVALRDVADREHVEERVVWLRLGADLEAAAEEAPVRDHDVEHRAGAPLAVDRHLDSRSPAQPEKTAKIAQR